MTPQFAFISSIALAFGGRCCPVCSCWLDGLPR